MVALGIPCQQRHALDGRMRADVEIRQRLAACALGMAMLQESSLLRGVLGLASPKLVESLRYLEAQANDRNGPPVRAAAHCFCAP